MRIDDDAVGIGRTGRGTAPAGRRAAEAPGAAPAAADRVTLSDTARRLAWVREAIGPLDEVREDRIADLRPVVSAGGYRVEPPLVARSLLVEELGGLVG